MLLGRPCGCHSWTAAGSLTYSLRLSCLPAKRNGMRDASGCHCSTVAHCLGPTQSGPHLLSAAASAGSPVTPASRVTDLATDHKSFRCLQRLVKGYSLFTFHVSDKFGAYFSPSRGTQTLATTRYFRASGQGLRRPGSRRSGSRQMAGRQAQQDLNG